ncbi:MAG: hypothetical protein QNI99_13010 [Woeseiaceae bacterium]|nr:hypothetical protein [Woeseiaceae bacterium]
MRILNLCALAALACMTDVHASESISSEPGGEAYYFSSHYTVEIDAPVSAVWDQLIDLGSWMYEFEMSLESGAPGEEGEVRRLYAEQDFFIQTIKAIPNELLVFANLPATFNGEESTGVTVISLSEADGVTTVSLTMSRRFSWAGTEPNPMRAMRESPDFQERTRAMWEDRFLGRLRSLIESPQEPTLEAGSGSF